MIKAILFSISILIGTLFYAQNYVELMNSPNANFYDVQQSFNDYWQGKEYSKGKGWKQFKRWEYLMEPRVSKNGDLPNPELTWTEHKKFQALNKVKNTGPNNKSANWVSLGPDSWSSIGWNPGIGRINTIAEDPNNGNIIYVGTPAGGCWKSYDYGLSWAPLTDHLATLGVSGIAVNHQNSNTVYIATGDGDGSDTYSIGVLKSNDGGSTWNPTGLNWSTSQSRKTYKIIMHPTDTNVLWAATDNGLWKTIDAGANWTSSINGTIRDIELNPGNPNTVYVCTGSIFYKSIDGGVNFPFNLSNGLPFSQNSRLAIGVTAADTNYVYVLIAKSSDSSFKGIYLSTNSGDNFSLRSDTPNILGYSTDGSDSGGQSWYDMAIAVSPTNKNEVYTGGINVWKSTNAGATFNALSKWSWPTGGYGYVHADIHTLDFYGNNLYCGSDGGVFRSTNNGSNWTDLTSGLKISQFYRLGNSVTNSSIIMAGAQDNGSYLHKNNTWTHVTGGDGMECVVDYSNANIMYSTSQYGHIYKSTNGGNSFNGITGSITTEEGAWVAPYMLDPVNHNTIYLGYENVWKSTNAGAFWYTISNFTSGDKLRSLVVAPSNNNVIYAATYSEIYKTIDGGSNWINISAGLPSTSISYITVHNTNPDIMWLSMSGSSNGVKVYHSTNGGNTWSNISGNLPNIPINCIVYENGSNNGVYVGTDLGVYYKDDNLSNWIAYMVDLPNVMVHELEIHYGAGKIRAATHGRGLWETDLYVTGSVGIKKESMANINIYPNPFTNVFTIENLSAESSIYIYSTLGVEVYKKTALNTNSIGVDLSNLPTGIYYTKIISPSGSITKSIIKR